MTNSKIRYQRTLKELRAVNKHRSERHLPVKFSAINKMVNNLKDLDLIEFLTNATITLIILTIIWIIIKYLVI